MRSPECETCRNPTTYKLSIFHPTHYDRGPKIRFFIQSGKLEKSRIRCSDFGCVNPVLISDDYEIIGGHARVEAAKLLGLNVIPVVRLSNLTPAERLAYSLADNRLAKFARYDRNLLAVQLEELKSLGFDEIDVTGFSIAEVDISLSEAGSKKRSATTFGGECRLRLKPYRAQLTRDTAAAANCEVRMTRARADLVLTEGSWCPRYCCNSNFLKTYGVR